MMRFNIVNPVDYWIGFLLIQSANICFAIGQVMFKKWHSINSSKDIIYNFSQMLMSSSFSKLYNNFSLSSQWIIREIKLLLSI